ncbi:MAG: isoprenyl transferase [Thermodesulfobacteriota bacterium]
MTELSQLDMPRHIAIIMDGNGRWARKRLLNRINGHKKGIEVVRDVVTYCREIGLKYLTLYTFSRENWQRPAEEVGFLMRLLENHLRTEEELFLKNKICFKAIGNLEDLPDSVREVIDSLEKKTASFTEMRLQLALSYSGREEIVMAARKLAEKVKKNEIRAEDITEKTFSQGLYTAGIPDPDLLIRTSGESRISNFLLWQLAYTEIHISDVLWPDFTRAHLDEALGDYHKRERRFGLVKEKVGALL